MTKEEAFINSSLTDGQYRKAMDNARNGQYKIIYAAPERLITDSFLEFAGCVDISMIAVDEAHCISRWGQDFRPSYVRIVDFVNLLPKRPVLVAYTATATKAVQEDIICTLGLKHPTVAVTGYDWKNLYYSVRKPKDKMAQKNHVPPYIIFLDKTLKEMSTYLPVTKEEMLEISGVGANKYEKYGEEFSAVIKMFREEKGI